MKYEIMCPACDEKIEMVFNGDRFTSEMYRTLVITLKDHCALKHKDSEEVKKWDKEHDGYVVFDEHGSQRTFPMIRSIAR